MPVRELSGLGPGPKTRLYVCVGCNDGKPGKSHFHPCLGHKWWQGGVGVGLTNGLQGRWGGEAAAYVPCDLVRSWGLCAAWCDSEVALCAVRSVAIFKLVCSVGATLDQLVCNTT